jgi:hypothetical protein
MIDCRRTTIILLFALLPFITIAQDSPPQSKTETINKIIEETSVSGELNQPIDELQNQFSQNPFGLPSATNKRMMDLYSEAFQPESTMKSIRNTFNKQFDAEHADSVVHWLNKSNTQNVHEIEKEFYTLQGIRKRVVSKYELEQNPPSEERTQLIQSLVQKRAAAETEIEARSIIFRALVTAFSDLSDQQSFSSTQIEGFVSNFRNQIKSGIDEQVTRHLMTKYHGLDDNALQEYISFYDTEAGQWLTDTTSESMQTALESAADQFLTSINKIDSE